MAKLPTLFSILPFLLLSACSKGDGSAKASLPNALPASWYTLPENGGPANIDTPSKAANAAVEAAFRAHARALDSVGSESIATPAFPEARPVDWTPWHLDGMVADFSVTGNGLFGPLLFGGTASVKGTWRRQIQQDRRGPAASKKSPVRFTSSMTARDLALRLEPVVRSALASGAVKNGPALRANLTSRGQEFLAVCAALDSLPRPRGWHVSGFQLQLSISASGQVNPTIGVGGALNVFFDWSRDEEPHSSVFVRSLPPPNGIARNAPSFVQTFQEVLASLPAEAGMIERSGFNLTEFQLGVAVGAGGNIGLVQAAASVQGKIIFESDADSLKLAQLPEPDLQNKALLLVNTDPSPAETAFAQENGVEIERWEGGGVAFAVPAERFRTGLTHALRMGHYFAAHARNVDTRNWKLDEIEVEFDASLQGSVKLVTIYGQGQIVLHFDRAHG